MGIMRREDWSAKWICAPSEIAAGSDSTLLRREFMVRPGLRRSIVHVTGLGQYEMRGTDCPHRERLGWLEQYHLNGPSLRYEHDLRSLYSKTLQDMADSQLPDGLVPDIAPEYAVFGGPFRDSPEWGSQSSSSRGSSICSIATSTSLESATRR